MKKKLSDLIQQKTDPSATIPNPGLPKINSNGLDAQQLQKNLTALHKAANPENDVSHLPSSSMLLHPKLLELAKLRARKVSKIS